MARAARYPAVPEEITGRRNLEHLKWLQRQIGEDLLDAIVTTTGEQACRREDSMAVVPAALLGP